MKGKANTKLMIVIDTETTDLHSQDALPLDKQPRIIELALLKLNDKTLEEVDHFHELIYPGFQISDEITKITGITNAMLEGKPPIQAHFPKITEFFLGEKILCAHNCEFDAKLMEFELRRYKREFRFPWPPERKCTVELTEHLKGFRLKLLDLYAMATKGGKIEGAHRALTDTRALATAIRWLRSKHKLL